MSLEILYLILAVLVLGGVAISHWGFYNLFRHWRRLQPKQRWIRLSAGLTGAPLGIVLCMGLLIVLSHF